MSSVTLVVLGRFPEIFDGFKESADRYLPNVPKIFVRDKELIDIPEGARWSTIQGPEVFNNAGNANLGWEAAPKDDILYVGDDVRFLQIDTVERLQEVAYSDPKVGIVSPKIIGAAGNGLQINPKAEGLTYSIQRLAFICVLIKREAINEVGYMDPVYGGSYGSDDSDYCHRVQLAGFKLAVTSSVSVEHRHAASTFTKTGPGADCSTGAEKFRKKWGYEAWVKTEQGIVNDAIVVAPNASIVETRFRRLRR